jgi:hypothetical protein
MSSPTQDKVQTPWGPKHPGGLIATQRQVKKSKHNPVEPIKQEKSNKKGLPSTSKKSKDNKAAHSIK